MRRNLWIVGASLLGAATSLAQSPQVVAPQRGLPAALQMPPDGSRGTPPLKLPDLPTARGLVPPPGPPPSLPLTPKPEPVPEPTVPQRFDTAALQLKRERNRWELWAGNLLLKDFGAAETEAKEALQVFRELHVNSRGSVGGVFEYWLADGQAPSGVTRYRRVVPFQPRSLRVEKASEQWVLRDANAVLYTFGRSESDARQALAVCQQYGFNQMGFVGQPTPILKYLMRDPSPSMSAKGLADPMVRSAGRSSNLHEPSMSAKGLVTPMATSAASMAKSGRQALVLPKEGPVGERVPFDARQIDLRRESGEWVAFIGRASIGRFGSSEREARDAVQALQQFRVTELCRVGESGFGFFLANGRAPTGTVIGMSARPLHVNRLAVKQVGNNWAVCEDGRPLWDFGAKAEDARHALDTIQHFGFDQVVPVAGRLNNMHLLVKTQ